MGLNIAVVLAYIVSFGKKFKKVSGCCATFKFAGKIIFKFMAPLIDSVLGKIK